MKTKFVGYVGQAEEDGIEVHSFVRAPILGYLCHQLFHPGSDLGLRAFELVIIEVREIPVVPGYSIAVEDRTQLIVQGCSVDVHSLLHVAEDHDEQICDLFSAGLTETKL